jgi:O-methyltransferase involved in polyketide biosynthesis
MERLKQETLEEAAANLADPNLCKTDNWIAGAKWQAERMYSEEDLKAAWIHGAIRSPEEFKHLNNFDVWLEHFKKK